MSAVDESLMESLSDIHRLADDILMDKREMVDLDAKRNKCREAFRSLKKISSSPQKNSEKTWVCFGNTFIKMDTEQCIKMLEKDQETINKEIDTLRDGLKPKVSKLHQLEGKPEVKGFDLKGLRKEELIFVT